MTPAAARGLAGPVTAAWAAFDDVAAASPAELRKGPRGGGRDRDKLIGHVIGAETAYARKLGVRLGASRPPATLPRSGNCARRSPPCWAPPRTAHP